MRFTKEDIEKKVGNVTCPQGECIRIAKEITEILLEGNIEMVNNKTCTALTEVIEELKRCINADESLATMWPSTGNDSVGNAVSHSLIVFNTEPIQSVAAWEGGIEIYDEAKTIEFIENTLRSKDHNNKIDVHQNKKSNINTVS